jgi:sortase A
MSAWIERALLAVAAICLGWFAAVHVIARLDQRAQQQELAELRAHRADIPLPAPHRERPKPRDVIGQLDVPRLGVSTIVRSGVDDGTLRRAVGHVPETALPGEAGNIALAAHRDTFFRPLKNIRRGDRVRFTTPDGVHEYRVSDTRVVQPDDVSVLEPTAEPTLTLITCYPFAYVGSAPQRFIVRATREAEAPRAVAAAPLTDAVPAVAATTGLAAVKAPVKPAKKRAVKPVKKAAGVKRAAAKPVKKKKKGFFGKLILVFR